MPGHVHKVIGRNGAVRWRAQFKFTKMGQIQRGSKTFALKREADEWLSSKLVIKVEANTGNAQTLAQYLWRWLERRQQSGFIRGNTAAGYATRIRGLENTIGTIRLSRLTHKDLRDYLEAMRNDGLSRSSINQARSILNRALADAVVDGTLGANPAAGLRIERAPQRREVVAPSPDEVKRFLAHIDANSDHGRFFHFLAGTGVRRSEAGAISWDDVDFQAKTVQIRKSLQRSGMPSGPSFVIGPVKTPSARRSVPLSARLIDMLAQQKDDVAQVRRLYGEMYQDYGLVFCQPNGQPLDVDNLSHLARRTRSKLGLSKAISSVHGLRHFFATQLIAAKTDPKTVQHLLGHAKIQTTLDLYVHHSEEAGRAAVDVLADLF